MKFKDFLQGQNHEAVHHENIIEKQSAVRKKRTEQK
jgi:hypothetical protein